MGRPINTLVHESWRAHIEEQSGSGLTVAAFCRPRGIAMHSFYAWRRRLATDTPAAESRQRAARSAGLAIPSTGRSAPGDDGEFIQIPLGTDTHSLCLEVVLPDQTHVRVPWQHLAAWELTLRVLLVRSGGPAIHEVPHV